MRLYALAKLISWASCAWIFLLAFYSTQLAGFGLINTILFGIAVIHVWLMLTRRFVYAFRITCAELVFAMICVQVLLYPPIGSKAAREGIMLMPFEQAFWVWLCSALSLGFLAWLCNKAANKLSRRFRDRMAIGSHFFSSMVDWTGMREYMRPWKLISFTLGMAVLVSGALHYRASDWDIPISIIMGTFTYVSAPWVLRIITSLQWRLFPAAILAYWLTVDGSYSFYNVCMGHPVSADLRRANFFASSLLYLLCGWLWLPRMSLREFLLELATAVHLRVCGEAKMTQGERRGETEK